MRKKLGAASERRTMMNSEVASTSNPSCARPLTICGVQDIKQLLETKPYHKEIAPQLEEYVGEQIGKGVADLDANTALLKVCLLCWATGTMHLPVFCAALPVLS